MIIGNVISKSFDSEGQFGKAGCHVFCGAHAASDVLLRIGARFALNGVLELLDFGNRCDMYYAARELRFLTADPVAAVCNIHLRRAFTVFQAQILISQTCTKYRTEPLLILDLMAPFWDESVNLKDSERLFEKTLTALISASAHRLIIIGVSPTPRIAKERAFLLGRLQQIPCCFNFLENSFIPATLPVMEAQPTLF